MGLRFLRRAGFGISSTPRTGIRGPTRCEPATASAPICAGGECGIGALHRQLGQISGRPCGGESAAPSGAYYDTAMRTISLRLPEALLAELDEAAKRRRVTKSSLVRESLEKAMRKQSSGAVSCYDLAHDLAGTVKGLPEDLADNPKYMDGFGGEGRPGPARHRPIGQRPSLRT